MFGRFSGANVNKDDIPILSFYIQQQQIRYTIFNCSLQVLNGRTKYFGYRREVKGGFSIENSLKSVYSHSDLQDSATLCRNHHSSWGKFE